MHCGRCVRLARESFGDVASGFDDNDPGAGGVSQQRTSVLDLYSALDRIGEESEMSQRERAFFIGGLVVLTAARIVAAAVLPLADDEAYYWTWSRHLAWGYPDHPPMIAAIIRLTTSLVGHTPLGVRLGSIVFALGTSLVLYDLGRQMFGPLPGLVAALTFQVIPLFALGAGFASPDGPMGFFWILTLWYLWRALHQDRMRDWTATGVALGLGIASKLPAIILGLSIGGFLLASPQGRARLGHAKFYALIAACALTIAPVVWWLVVHRDVVLLRAHQSQPWVRLPHPVLSALAFFGAQFLYYGPMTFPLLLAALRDSLHRARADERFALLSWGTLPLLGLTWAGSLSGLPKPHWVAPSYIVALIPAAALWVAKDPWGTRWRIPLAAFGINALVIGTAFLALFSATSPAAVAVRGWDEVATRLTDLLEQTPATPGVFVLTTEYQTASQLAFHLQERYLVTTIYQDTAFAARTDPRELTDWNAVFVNNLAGGTATAIQPLFKRVEPLPPIEVRIKGQVVQRLLVSRGYGFRGFTTSNEGRGGSTTDPAMRTGWQMLGFTGLDRATWETTLMAIRPGNPRKEAVEDVLARR